MPGDLIQTPQTRWSQGAYESVNYNALIVLVARVNTTVPNDAYSTLRKLFTTAGYQVPAGKNLYVTRIQFRATTNSVSHQILYGDTDVGINSAAAPAAPVYLNGDSLGIDEPWIATSSNTHYTLDLHFKIPGGKYITITSTANTVNRVMLIGHEE